MKTFFTSIRLVALAMAALIASSSLEALAAVTTYTSRATFNAAVGTTTTEDFQSYLVNAPFHTVPVDTGDFTISMTGAPSLDYNIIDVAPPETSETDVNGSTNMRVFTNGNPKANLVFTFDTPIVAFGADFRNLNDDQIRTQILSAGDNMVPPVVASGALSFFGFKSTVPFTTVTFDGQVNDVYGIDNVSYAVPESSTLALAAIALIGAGRCRRSASRKRAS